MLTRLRGAAVTVAGMASIALAQPAPPVHAVTRPAYEGCSVTFVRSPDSVRAVIEKWVASEPSCTSSIELRVIETDHDTLYLVAQRADGRIHEREVPDAAAAGVLVASWVADDWSVAPPVVDDVFAHRMPGPDAHPMRTAAPGMVVAARRPEVPRENYRGLTVSLTSGERTESGFRLEVDLLGKERDGWHLGVIAAIDSAPTHTENPTVNYSGAYDGSDVLSTLDTRLLAGLSYRGTFARYFELGGGAGIGTVYAHDEWTTTTHPTSFSDEVMTTTSSNWSLAGELSLTAGIHISPRVTFVGGVTAIFFTHHSQEPSEYWDFDRGAKAEASIGMRVGL